MVYTLAQAQAISTNMLERGVLQTFIQTSPILDRIPFKPIEGNAYAYNQEATMPGVAFRAVNAAYVPDTGTFNQATEKLVILGGEADVDTFIQKTLGNLNDQRGEQTRMKVKAASYRWQDAFFNGDVTGGGDAPNGFDGLKKRLTGTQVFAAGTNGIPVPGINGQNGAIYANNLVISKIRSAMRRLGLDTSFMQDIAGKRQIQWNGIPIIDPEVTTAGTRVLPQTETQGTASGTASSVYAVRYGNDVGDRAVTGLTNGGVDVRDLGELQSQPVFRTRIEFFCGLAVFGGQAGARMTGVLNA
jgi:hypothetical protein